MVRKRVLFVLNAAGGGATQGIKEYLRYQRDIDAYLVLPTKPNPIQEEWISEFTKGYIVCEMPWWNLPNGMPWIYKKILHWKNNRKGKSGEKGAEIIANFIKKNAIDFVYTGSILIREGALAARKAGIKHFWHIKETFGENGRVKFVMRDDELQNFILNYSDRVICMTDYIRSFFNQNIDSPKLLVIHDGIDPKLFFGDSKEKRMAIREKYGIADDETLVGMVASLSSIWKNHKVFIKAAAILPRNKKFRFIAFGPEPKRSRNPIYNTGFKYYTGLKSLVINLGLQNNFIWAGFFDDIPALFQGLDVFIHPCETEPFGRVVIEAMAAGVPLIVPNSGGASEPVKELEIGFRFDPNNENDLAEKVMVVVEKGLERNFEKNKIILINSTYSLDAYVRNMNQLFE
ncbi:MAG: hypothetical protein CFE21_00195 [Bacteroidetes bacterium B1(2017)]|nr:MAG: hypothetical protein CFE21_00195 [Bacteroidetes bacterium B1(2017)]